MKTPIRRFQRRYQLALLFSLLALFGVSISAQRIWETLPASFKEKMHSTRRATDSSAPGKYVATRGASETNNTTFDPAQAGLTIPQNIFPGGGGSSIGGTLSLDGTIGQGLAGGAMSGGTLSATSGFWGASTAVQCPTISVNNPQDPSGVIGTALSRSFTQSGGAGTVTFSLNSGTLPTGVTLAADGKLSGTPTQFGTFPITVKATDSNNCSGVGATYTLVISCQSLSVINPAVTSATVRQAFSQTFTQVGGLGTVAFRLNSGTLPPGLALAANGTLSGVPTQAGSFTFSVSIADVNSCAVSGLPYTLTVNGTTTARVIRAVDATGNPAGTVVVPIELVSQGDENAISFSLTFDSTVLSNPQAVLGSDATGASINVNSGQTASGRLGLIVALPAGQAFNAGVRRIFAVTFTVAANTNANTTPIGFGNQPVAQEIASASAATLVASFTAGTVTISRGIEADVTPRPNGNGSVTVSDYVQIGRFAAGLDTPANGSEFQRADCAPRDSLGNGLISVSDFVQAGRYAAGLDPLVSAGGPSEPAPLKSPDALAKLLPAVMDVAAQNRVIRVLNAAAAPGGAVNVIVEMDSQGNENALGCSLTFNPAIFTNPKATLGTGATGASLNFNTNQLAQGRLGVVVALPSGQSFAAGTRQLVVIAMTIANNAPAGGATIDFGNQPVAKEIVDANANDLAATYTAGVVTVQAQCPTITISPATLANGQIGQPYSRQLTQTGGVGTIVWAISTGALPSGISLNASTGLLSGTPTVSGSFAVTVRATDANGCVGSQAYTLVIGACPVITITPANLPNGTVGVTYSLVLTASGGTAPYSFSVNAGSFLPADMELAPSGLFSGKPFNVGSFSFTVKVTDANGCSGTQSYSLTVNPGTYSVSGRVVDLSGIGIAGVTLTFSNSSGSPAATQTDNNGNWTQSGFAASTSASSCTNQYTVKAAKAGYSFAPVSQTFCGTTSSLDFTGSPVVTSVSAASFQGQELAQESIIAAFGINLATKVEIATATPLPTTLAGTTVKVRDSAGVERNAPLFFVAPSQVNYQMPPGTATGPATVTVISGDNKISLGTIQVASVAPALFTASASGTGAPAANVLRFRNGVQSAVESAANLDSSPKQIDLGPEGDLVYLVLYGGGVRLRTKPENISINLGGIVKTLNPALYEDGVKSDQFVGLDQVNVLLPRTLIGKGVIDVILTVDGKVANTVKINIK